MERRTGDDYEAVLKEIKTKFPGMKVKYSMADYEIGIRNALEKVFPGIQHCGCIFHLFQVR